MASVNKVILVGNLGKDPEVRYTASGSVMCNLSIATTHTTKAQSGERKEETEWHRVVMFSRLAEIAGEYLRKGRPVYIEGRIQTRKWQDQSGQDRYTTEIVGEQMQMLGGRDDALASGGASGAQNQNQAPQTQRSRTQAPQQNYQAQMPAGGMSNIDDIPFAPLRNLHCF